MVTESVMVRERKPQNELHRRRRMKNIALACAIAGLMLLFYVITIVRMG
jgi:hypothetical protein